MQTADPYRISLFDKALHDRSAFSCGHAAIDTWFRTSISDQIKGNRIRVYCAAGEGGKVAGFYALCAHSIRAEAAGHLAGPRDRHDIPTIYLPSIGVARDCQGRGLGAALMGHAIRTSVGIASQIGAAALVLDVKDDADLERRMKFYTGLGFGPLGGSDRYRVFLSRKVARLSVEKATPL